jgi:hypothetical protein
MRDYDKFGVVSNGFGVINHSEEDAFMVENVDRDQVAKLAAFDGNTPEPIVGLSLVVTAPDTYTEFWCRVQDAVDVIAGDLGINMKEIDMGWQNA